MDDDRLLQLLRGYRLPEVSSDLDDRVLREGVAILEGGHTWATLEQVGRTLLHRLGFGYLAWLFDFVTIADAEYRVDII
jgi:hypothetical protein